MSSMAVTTGPRHKLTGVGATPKMGTILIHGARGLVCPEGLTVIFGTTLNNTPQPATGAELRRGQGPDRGPVVDNVLKTFA